VKSKNDSRDLGLDAYRKRIWGLSIQHLRSAIQEGPQSPKVHLALATSLISKGRFEPALKVAAKLVKRGLELHRSGPIAIECALRLQKTDLAEEFARKVFIAKSNDVGAGEGVLKIYQRFGLADAGLQLAESIAAGKPDDLNAARLVAQALLVAGKLRDAIVAFRELVKRAPDSIDIRIRMARTLSAANEWHEAVDAWADVLRLDPCHAEALRKRAVARAQVNESAQAAAEMAEALRTLPLTERLLMNALAFAGETRRWTSVLALSDHLDRAASEASRTKILLERNTALWSLGMPLTGMAHLRAEVLTGRTDDHFARKVQKLGGVEGRPAAEPVDGTKVQAPPIDVVYTWVDAQDPAWMDRFSKYTGIDLWKNVDRGSNWRRYESYGEISFSIRTVGRFFPAVRNIFIVTDDQRFDLSDLPPALRQKVRFVDHREIIPSDIVALPTFTSDVIETFLHRIPGLSDTFLYFNDDTFLGRALREQHLFDAGGKPYVNVVPHDWPDDPEHAIRRASHVEANAHAGRSLASLALFKRRLGSTPKWIDLHQFRTLTKELCSTALDVFGDDWQTLLFQHRVRRGDSPRVCLMRDWLALHLNLEVPAPTKPRRLSWVFGLDFDWEHVAMLLKFRPHTFCLDITEPRRDRFAFLAANYLRDEDPASLDIPEDEFLRAARAVELSGRS
jgi:tetratricopeptide (TPR) repeat protein